MRSHLLWLLLALGCTSRFHPPVNQEAQVRESLDQIAVGSTEDQIKAALDSVGAGYSYDDFYNCYEGTIAASRQTKNGVKSVIWLRMYMDEKRKFTKSEVETILTHR